MRSRIEPMKKIARSLRQHRELILNYQKLISSGVVEGLNNNAKVTMRKSYGFRTDRYSNWPSITHLASCLSRKQPTISSEEPKIWTQRGSLPLHLNSSDSGHTANWAPIIICGFGSAVERLRARLIKASYKPLYSKRMCLSYTDKANGSDELGAALRLPVSMIEGLKVLAHKRDVPYQSLLKIFRCRATGEGTLAAAMTRRNFSLVMAASLGKASETRKVAITMDDVNWKAIPEPFSKSANHSILGALAEHGGLQAALFVCGANVDNENGRGILLSWNEAAHLLGNHTYSHRTYSSMSYGDFTSDLLRCEPVVSGYPRFQRFFRFPALKEGETAAKRDLMRAFLSNRGYRNGHVTIDASDWYYDARLRQKLKQQPDFDTQRYRQPYLDHIWDRATYYDALSQKVLGRSATHTLLVHYNLINALFLRDVLAMFRNRGWMLSNAEDAYADPVFSRSPKTVPAGESLIWALAKETGRFEHELRYPGEDDVYEKPKLDQIGL